MDSIIPMVVLPATEIIEPKEFKLNSFSICFSNIVLKTIKKLAQLVFYYSP